MADAREASSYSISSSFFFSPVSLHFSADRLTSLNTKKADLLFVAASSPEVVASLLPGLFGYTYSDLKVLF